MAAGKPVRAFNTAMSDWSEQASHLYSGESEQVTAS